MEQVLKIINRVGECPDAVAPVNYPVRNFSHLSDLNFEDRFQPNEEQQLLQYLLANYDKSVRPVFKASTVVTILIGITLTHIFNIDEKKQVLSLNAWLEQEWYDERLTWEPQDFSNITQFTVPSNFLWTPDIVLYNNAEDFSEGIMQTNVGLYYTGNILWAPPVKFRSICKLNVAYFPFDLQVCQLRFASWIYDGSQIDVNNRSEDISLDAYTDNGEWAIDRTKVERKVNFYPCCGPVPFPEMQFKLQLRRRTLFYLYNIIIPCIMLSVLTLMQFRLPCESGEKITLGLTVLLAYSVFSFKIAENMPETSDVVPVIAIYLVSIMSISAVSVTFSVMVLGMRHGSARQRRVPIWIRKFAYNVIARMIFFRIRRPTKRSKHVYRSLRRPARNECDRSAETENNRDPSSDVHDLIEMDDRSKINHVGNHSPVNQPLIENSPVAPPQFPSHRIAPKVHFSQNVSLTPSVSDLHDDCHFQNAGVQHNEGLPVRSLEINTSSLLQRLAREGRHNNLDVNNPPMPSTDSSSPRLFPQRDRRTPNNDVMWKAALLMQQFEFDLVGKEIDNEWRQIAQIFDGFYFWFVLLLTVGITLGSLVIAPMFNSGNLYQHVQF